MTSRGVCRNARCEKARCQEQVERYPGPGIYCPECGDILQAVAWEKTPRGPFAQFGRLAAVEALAKALRGNPN